MEIRGLSGTYQGQTIPVKDSVVLGRDPKSCSLLFPAESNGVSRVHCRLSRDGEVYTITDLGSTYGTYVNGVKIPTNAPTVLKGGDTFAVGNVENTFSVSDNAIPSTSAPGAAQIPQPAVRAEAFGGADASGSSASKDKIVIEINPHWVTVLKFIVIGLIFIYLGFAVHPALFVVSLIMFLYVFIVMKSTRLYLTGNMVVGKTGIIHTTELTSPIRNIQDMRIEENMWGKIFGYANISISTAGHAGTEYKFKSMGNAKKFKSEFVRLSM